MLGSGPALFGPQNFYLNFGLKSRPRGYSGPLIPNPVSVLAAGQCLALFSALLGSGPALFGPQNLLFKFWTEKSALGVFLAPDSESGIIFVRLTTPGLVLGTVVARTGPFWPSKLLFEFWTEKSA